MTKSSLSLALAIAMATAAIAGDGPLPASAWLGPGTAPPNGTITDIGSEWNATAGVTLERCAPNVGCRPIQQELLPAPTPSMIDHLPPPTGKWTSWLKCESSFQGERLSCKADYSFQQELLVKDAKLAWFGQCLKNLKCWAWLRP